MGLKRFCGVCAFAVVMMWACAASAHLLPARHGTIHIAGRHVYVVLTVPASALTGFDDNHDGLIDIKEITHHYVNLQKQIAEGFSLKDAKAKLLKAGSLLFPAKIGVEQRKPGSYIVVLYSQLYASPPKALTVTDSLFGRSGEMIKIRATRDRPSGKKDVELAVLRPDHDSFHLFVGPVQTALQFIGVGINHILTGLDHLLFLLTIIVAGVNVRQWLILTGTFTIAHSITLALTVLGIVAVSPAIVEPAIAASIVVMALYNLFSTTEETMLWRIGTVFACGLIHGMGFASSLADEGINYSHLLPTLAGFNIGIELGQGLFIVGVLIVMFAISLLPVKVAERRFMQGSSIIAGLIGAGMIAVRIAAVV